MPTFRSVQNNTAIGGGKYYPVATTLYEPADIKLLAKTIEKSSTVAEADILAVLNALGPAMWNAFNQGRTVKLQGLGSFALVINPKRNSGKATAAEVTAADIDTVKCKFTPEFTWNAGRTAQTRSLTDDLEWVKLGDEATSTNQATTPSGSDTQTGEEENFDPLGN